MIERILPDGVAAAWTTTDPADVRLFPEEEAHVRGAVPSRRREFAAGRHCARQALTRLGLPATAIPTGDRGQPLWPEGVVGSITHCDGYRAAVAARQDRLAAIGIDAEVHRPLPPELHATVLLPDERADLAHLAAADPAVHWPVVAFSAKEALYKAWFTVTGRWLGFLDARLRFDPAGAFTADLLLTREKGPSRVPSFTGRWHTDGAIVVTAVTAE